MIRRFQNGNSNRGASLVLVIVSMLFIGIIAAAILVLTTGNIDANKTSKNSGENFYSAESVIDSIKIYLQKKANEAATEAYAATLSDVASDPSVDINNKFEEHFSLIMKDKMDIELDKTQSGSLCEIFSLGGSNYGSLGIADGNTISIDPDVIKYNATSNTIEGIHLIFTDATGYSTSIDTDLKFACKMPPLSWNASDAQYEYNVDKFIIISENGVESATGNASGTVTGNIYSGNDINMTLASASGATGTLNFNSQYIISGGEVILSNGNVNFKGLKAGGRATELLDLKRKEALATLKTQDDATLWVKGIELKGGKVNVTVNDNQASIHVKDDLSLNGEESKFTMTDGDYYGFSADNTTAGSVSAHNPSSAIVVNGANSVLDMSGADSLTLAGTAYTQVPEIAGLTAAEDCEYFVQGESVTFKSLQSAYLVPAEYIRMNGTTGGYNPIPDDQFSKFQGVDTSALGTAGVNLNGSGYRTTTVRYSSATGAKLYYFVYWDFASVGDAVRYFNTQYSSNKALLESKIGMIGSGKISLPSTVYSKGDLITWNGTTLGHTNSTWVGSGDKTSDCIAYDETYKKYCSALSEDSTIVSDALFDNMFANGDFDLCKTSRSVELKSPKSWTTDDYSYTGYTLNATGQDDGKTWKYVLLTGENLSISDTATDTKYIVVANGNVTVTASTFNGLIIAKGKVYIGSNVNMTCLGNFHNKIVQKTDTTNVKEEFISEFDALLNVTVDNDSDMENGNTVLRNIFGVAGSTSTGSGNSGSAKDIASVGTVNFKKN